MTQLVSPKRVALAGAVLCFAAVACGSSAAQALSPVKSLVPAIAAASSVAADATAGESLGITSEQASPRATRTLVPARSTPSTTPHRTTSTTVLGGGSPATWPAARAVAPSLAGAYSPNLKTAFIALVELLGLGWLASQSEPGKELSWHQRSNIYTPQVYLMRDMVDRGWHYPQTQPRLISSRS